MSDLHNLIKLSELSAANAFNLQGVVAVITGGGSGIGLMMDSALLANGATVYIVGLNQADMDARAKMYTEAAAALPGGGKMYGIEGDISKKEECRRIATVIGQREKYVTVLFNNAGIGGGFHQRPTTAKAADYVKAMFDDVPQEAFIDVFNTNAVGPYFMTMAFLELLEAWKESGEPAAKRIAPQVIMTSSMTAWSKDSITSGHTFPYMFSKSAIGIATASLATELLPLGIRVNGLAPGVFPSELLTPGVANAAGVYDEEKVPDFEARQGIPMPTSKRGGTRRDIGTMALALVVNKYVNGETVLVDGGTSLKVASAY